MILYIRRIPILISSKKNEQKNCKSEVLEACKLEARFATIRMQKRIVSFKPEVTLQSVTYY